MMDIYKAEFQDAEIGGDKFWMLIQTMPDLNGVFVKVGCRAPCCPSMRTHQHS